MANQFQMIFFSDRRAFAKLFAITGSDVGLTQSASKSIIVKARGWINQVATGLKGAKSVTHRYGVAAWGVPLLTFVFFSTSKSLLITLSISRPNW